MKKTAKRGTVRWAHVALAVFFCFLSISTVYAGYLGEQFIAGRTTEEMIAQPFAQYVAEIENPLNSFLHGAEKAECPKKLLPENTNFRFIARDENGEIVLSTYDENDSVLYQSYYPLSVAAQSESGQTQTVTFTVDCYLLEQMQVHDIFYRTLLLHRYFRFVALTCDVLSAVFAIAFLLFVLRLFYTAVCESKTQNGGQSVFLSVPPDLFFVCALPFGAYVALSLMRGTDTDGIIQAFLNSGAGIFGIFRIPLLYTGAVAVALLWLILLVYSLRRGGIAYAVTYRRFEHASLSKRFYIGYVLIQAFKIVGIALYLYASVRMQQAVLAGEAPANILPQRMGAYFLQTNDLHARVRTVAVLLFILLEKATSLPMLFRCIREVRKQTEKTEKYVLGDLTDTHSGKLYKNFADHERDVRSIADRICETAGEYVQSSAFKAELITNLSHDIKTPLTAIMSYARLLRNPALTSEEKMQYLEVLKRHSDRMRNLVQDLTQLSDAASGNVRAELTQVDLGAHIAQAVQGFAERLQGERIAVQLRLPDEPVTVSADVGLLWRVADNLLNNICKYAQKGSTVYIDVRVCDGTAIAQFSNTPEYALCISGEALMERFVRADASRHTEGSGLGLSIAHTLMQLQGGELRIETESQMFTAQIVFPN